MDTNTQKKGVEVQATCIDVIVKETEAEGRLLLLPVYEYEYNGERYTTEQSLNVEISNEYENAILIGDMRGLIIDPINPATVLDFAPKPSFNIVKASKFAKVLALTPVIILILFFVVLGALGFGEQLLELWKIIKEGFSNTQTAIYTVITLIGVGVVAVLIARHFRNLNRENSLDYLRTACTARTNGYISLIAEGEALQQGRIVATIDYTVDGKKLSYVTPHCEKLSLDAKGQEVTVMYNPKKPHLFYVPEIAG